MTKWKTVLILALQTIILCAITVLCVVPFSCKVTEEGIIFVGGDYVSPVLEEVNVIDERTVQINFSEMIKMKSFVVSEQIADISDSYEHSYTEELSPAIKAATGGYGRVESVCEVSEDGCILTVSAEDRYDVGKSYEICGTVEDKGGNTLTFCVPFCGYNSCVPKLVMTEILPTYKKYKEGVYRCEFVEILALTDGNLSGLELVSAADGDAKKYDFPSVNVRAGQVFVVHLRNAGEGCISETEDLNASTAAFSAKNALDIWAENTKPRLGDVSDIIVIRNSINGSILDAVMYAEQSATEWGKGMSALAQEVKQSGIYDSSEVSDAEINTGFGSVAGKTLCRSDASELQKKAFAGEYNSDEAEYPVQRKEDNWVIKSTPNTTVGTL